MRRLLCAYGVALAVIGGGSGPVAAQNTSESVVLYRVSPGGVRVFIRDASTNDDSNVPMALATLQQLAGAPGMIVLSGGVTSWQVVQAFEQIETLSGEPSLPPEGGLAPGGYVFGNDETKSSVIARMQERQAQTLNELWDERAEGLPYDEKYDALILASIVERETSLEDEYPLIASVLLNRLDKDMRLQIDSTVSYGITEGRKPLNRGIRMSELRIENPYNTYMNNGLPPTPISNPSVGSIEAALNPADTDYVFYVREPSGGYVFAETLEEHNENVQRWRRFEAKGNSENSD